MHTVQEVLKGQRENIDFDVNSLGEFLYGPERYNIIKNEFPNWVRLPSDYNTYNMGRLALMKEAYSMLPLWYNNFSYNNDEQTLYTMASTSHQLPGSVSALMFAKCIELMGTQEQIDKFFKKTINYEIVGCYAQTQIGHGSDVKSLETTATFDEKTQQFVINSPSISAAKFWPGELGLGATWALVYAQTIVKGKNCGVQAFFVPIRDENQQVLPGVQSGDIGPKLGYHAKQNGYLLLSNVRVPRTAMLGRFNEVTPDGKFISKGDERIAYATMMKIRVLISVVCPRLYGILITVAARYSMFRTQFKGKGGEKKVIDYQTQQDKIISRVAEAYGIVAAGHKVQQIAVKNEELIKNKGDASLMQQTHIILSFSKALYSEIVLEGMQICRKACGGHGFSHYAGFNTALGEYYTNPTHEGQNTILYIQVARYIMKNYKHFMMQSKPLGESVKYIESIDFYKSYKCKITDENVNLWETNDMRIILTQGCIYLIEQISQSMMSKEEGETELDVVNYKKGSKFQKLAILHGYRYTFECFIERIMSCRNEKARQIINDLCLLFGCTTILNSNISSILVEGGFITQAQVQSLLLLKETILDRLRPKLIGLVDAFGYPQHLIRSELAHGNPYENYLNLARKSQINQKIQESAFIVKNVKNYLHNARL